MVAPKLLFLGGPKVETCEIGVVYIFSISLNFRSSGDINVKNMRHNLTLHFDLRCAALAT